MADLFELAKTTNIPDWAPPESRFWNLYMHDLWLEGKQYSGIDAAFNDESMRGGQARKMFEKRPSVRLQLPAVGSELIQNKLFAPSRFPAIVHDNKNLVKGFKCLKRKAQLDRKMLDIAYWGQSGSVGVTLKVIDGVPSIKVFPGKYCTPIKDESDQLERLVVHYPVLGSKFLGLKESKDNESNPIDAEAAYWYIRSFDKEGVFTAQPIPYGNWNPVEHDVEDWAVTANPELSMMHTKPLDKCPAVWIPNLASTINTDGRSTFALALPNCMSLDYMLSQMARGLNAAAHPTLVIKGRVLNYERGGQVMLGPSNMIQLSEDRQEGPGMGRSGASAEFLEMNGGAIQIAMNDWVAKIVHWTKEIASQSKKDPDTISGAISGKALELINEPFLETVLVERLAYGDYGYLPISCDLANMLMLLGDDEKVFNGVSEQHLEEAELDWPDFYQASPQEMQPLITALTTAVGAGLEDPDVAKTVWRGQVGIRHLAIEGEEDAEKANEDGRQKALEALGKAPKLEGEGDGTGGGVKSKPKPKAK